MSGSLCVHWVMFSPLKIADGSMIPEAAWEAAGSKIRLAVRDCLLSLSTDLLSVLDSVLFTTVEEEEVVD